MKQCCSWAIQKQMLLTAKINSNATYIKAGIAPIESEAVSSRRVTPKCEVILPSSKSMRNDQIQPACAALPMPAREEYGQGITWSFSL